MIALFGGSFDPVHLGHLDLALSLEARFGFEKIYFVPAKKNPLKSATSAPPHARLTMLKLALRELGEPRFEALDWEVNASGPSYTVRTVEKLTQSEGKPVAVLMGNEVFRDLERWHEPVKLVRLANLVVTDREDGLAIDPPAILARLGIRDVESDSQHPDRLWHSGHTRWIERVPFEPLPFSATGLRAALARREAPGTVPVLPQGIQRSVWLFIKENHLYSVTS